MVKKFHDICVLSVLLCDITLDGLDARLFFADLLWSKSQQPESVSSKCFRKPKQHTGKSFAGESTKICIPAGAELIQRHAEREVISKQVFVLTKYKLRYTYIYIYTLLKFL